MKKVILLIFTALILVGNVWANIDKGNESAKEQIAGTKASYSLKGTVYDPICNETVSGASITVDGEKYYSDFSGNFEIPALTKGKHTLSVDFISYQSRVMIIDLNKSEELKIEIKQQ